MQYQLIVSNANIYCVTRYLFTDSLQWAKEEKKDSCVLITDYERFLSLASSAVEDVRFDSVKECKYLGRTIEENNPGPQSLTNYFLSEQREVAYLKPIDYQQQKEIRAIWYSPTKDEATPITLDVDGVADLTLPIDISGINFDEIHKGDIKLGARIYKRDKTEPAEYVIEEPSGFFTPVIYCHKEGPRYFGFAYPGSIKKISNGLFKNANAGINYSPIGLIFCCVELDNIERIEFIQIKNTEWDEYRESSLLQATETNPDG